MNQQWPQGSTRRQYNPSDEQDSKPLPNPHEDQFEQDEQQDEPEYDSASLLGPPKARQRIDSISPSLPQLPLNDGDLGFDISTIISTVSSAEAPATEDFQKVQKRASNVLKLSEENERLKKELKAMADRLEAAERRRLELEKRGVRASD